MIDGELLSGRVLDDGTVGVVGDDRLERGGDLHILGGHGEGVFSVLGSDGGSIDLDGLDLVPICRSNGQNDLVAEVSDGLVCGNCSVLDASDHDLVFSHLERRRNGDILGRHGEGVDPFLGSDGGSVELDGVDLVSLCGRDGQDDLVAEFGCGLSGHGSVLGCRVGDGVRSGRSRLVGICVGVSGRILGNNLDSLGVEVDFLRNKGSVLLLHAVVAQCIDRSSIKDNLSTVNKIFHSENCFSHACDIDNQKVIRINCRIRDTSLGEGGIRRFDVRDGDSHRQNHSDCGDHRKN